MIRRFPSLVAFAAVLVCLPFLSWAQVAPSVPFAPSNAGGGGGGGGACPGAACDAEYLRLDTSNDPLTGTLSIAPPGAPGAPAIGITYIPAGVGLFADAVGDGYALGIEANGQYVASMTHNSGGAVFDVISPDIASGIAATSPDLSKTARMYAANSGAFASVSGSTAAATAYRLGASAAGTGWYDTGSGFWGFARTGTPEFEFLSGSGTRWYFTADVRGGMVNFGSGGGGQVEVYDPDGFRNTTGIVTSTQTTGTAHSFRTSGSGGGLTNLMTLGTNGASIIDFTLGGGIELGASSPLISAKGSYVDLREATVLFNNDGAQWSQSAGFAFGNSATQAKVSNTKTTGVYGGALYLAGYADAASEIGVILGTSRTAGQGGDDADIAVFGLGITAAGSEDFKLRISGNGDVIPEDDSASTLGSPTKDFGTIYVDNIASGDATIGIDDNLVPLTDAVQVLGVKGTSWLGVTTNILEFDDLYIKADLSTGTPTCAASTEGIVIYVRDNDYAAGPKNGLCLCTSDNGATFGALWSALNTEATAACADLNR